MSYVSGDQVPNWIRNRSSEQYQENIREKNDDNSNKDDNAGKRSYCSFCECSKIKLILPSVISFLVIILCWLGLGYQTYNPFIKYFSFPTKVQVSPTEDSIVPMPSVTICIPSMLIRSKLKSSDMFGAQIEQELKKIADNFAGDKNVAAKNISEREMYKKFQKDAMAQIPGSKLFDMGFQYKDIIECRVLAPVIKQKVAITSATDNGWMDCLLAYNEPLESLSSTMKCFTYFSKLNNPEGSEDQYSVDITQGLRSEAGLLVKMNITLNTTEYINRIRFGEEIITIHSSKTVASDSQQAAIKPGRLYDIYFNRIGTILMERPYDTGCIVYNDADASTPQSKADCLDRCITKMYLEKCNCFPRHIFIRKDLADGNNTNHDICDKSFVKHMPCFDDETNQVCRPGCPPDCISSYYQFDIAAADKPTDIEILEAPDNKTQDKLKNDRRCRIELNIWKQSQGDVTYTHVPQQDIPTLFGTVGGLASLWLGISLWMIYTYFRDLFGQCYQHHSKLSEYFSCCHKCGNSEFVKKIRTRDESRSRSRDRATMRTERIRTGENRRRKMSERMGYMDNHYNKKSGGHLKNSMLMNDGSTGPAKPGYQSNLQEERSTKQYMRY